MKHLPLILLLLLVNRAIGQSTFYCHVDFMPIGSKLSAIASAGKTADAFTFSSRQLPGIPFRVLQADSVTVKGDSVWGKMRLLTYTLRFRGIVLQDSLALTLINPRNGKIGGSITGSKNAFAPTNYAGFVQQLTDSTEKLIFNKSYVENQQWNSFKQGLGAAAPALQDDLEMLLLFYKDVRNLPFTHFEIVKRTPGEFRNMFADSKDDTTAATLTSLPHNTALLHIAHFNGDGSRIDSLMKLVVAKSYQHLIIDLRGNGGGGAGAAMELTKYLSAEARRTGAIVTRQWFNQYSAPPTAAQYSLLQPFSKGSTLKLIQDIPTTTGFYLHIQPAANTYKGKLYLLTDGRTASTCEPIVYGMQYFKKATVVGAKTAGAVLSKIPVWMGNDWVLFAPMADYFTIDGHRLDKNGVQPDVVTEPAQALNKALELIAAGK